MRRWLRLLRRPALAVGVALIATVALTATFAPLLLSKAPDALNVSARRHPNAAVGLGLGYLVGAAEKAADANNGIDADLIRRLRAGAEFSPHGTLPPPFKAAYERGIEAGNGSG